MLATLSKQNKKRGCAAEVKAPKQVDGHGDSVTALVSIDDAAADAKAAIPVLGQLLQERIHGFVGGPKPTWDPGRAEDWRASDARASCAWAARSRDPLPRPRESRAWKLTTDDVVVCCRTSRVVRFAIATPRRNALEKGSFVARLDAAR